MAGHAGLLTATTAQAPAIKASTPVDKTCVSNSSTTLTLTMAASSKHTRSAPAT